MFRSRSVALLARSRISALGQLSYKSTLSSHKQVNQVLNISKEKLEKLFKTQAKKGEEMAKERIKKAGESDPKKDGKDEFPGGWTPAAVSLAVIVLLYITMDAQSYKEISWKEFFHDCLEAGIVQRLEVVNKRWVRIITSSGKYTGQQPYFNIGSVDSFERSLAAAQLHLGFDADRQIPVLYKEEFD